MNPLKISAIFLVLLAVSIMIGRERSLNAASSSSHTSNKQEVRQANIAPKAKEITEWRVIVEPDRINQSSIVTIRGLNNSGPAYIDFVYNQQAAFLHYGDSYICSDHRGYVDIGYLFYNIGNERQGIRRNRDGFVLKNNKSVQIHLLDRQMAKAYKRLYMVIEDGCGEKAEVEFDISGLPPLYDKIKAQVGW